ncbi:Hypothetical predicted protein, partial [Marmota monax]
PAPRGSAQQCARPSEAPPRSALVAAILERPERRPRPRGGPEPVPSRCGRASVRRRRAPGRAHVRAARLRPPGLRLRPRPARASEEPPPPPARGA